MFDNLEVATDVEQQEDKVGGGFASIDKTGHYNMKIKKAYAGQSSGGAYSVNLVLEREDGARLNYTGYITSGTAKGCKNYYLDKNGKKQYLPDYNRVKNLDALLGFDRAYPKTETGSVMLWDKDLSKEVPQEKQVINEWIGKEIGVLVMKVLEDKYGEEHKFREKYQIEHFLDAITNQTRNEKIAGKNGFKDEWIAKFNSEYVKDDRVQSLHYIEPTDNVASTNDTSDEVPF